MTAAPFPPGRDAALARIAAVDAAAYARTRNAIDGAVTRLSPYLTHGLLTLDDVRRGVPGAATLPGSHRLWMELGWRAYFHHQWACLGDDGICRSQHPGPLPDETYADAVPEDVRRGATGVPAIDHAVRGLLDTGWLHNHARLWLASYLVHLRRVHWRAGAEWMIAHLLDGDRASNTLSWQWVAGTASHKPYLFNADNVERWAPSDWLSRGSGIDRSYEALEAVARGAAPPLPAGCGPGVAEPPVFDAPPPDAGFGPPQADAVQGRRVWLLHPWALRPPPPAWGTDVCMVGLSLPAWHRGRPWSLRRWQFVAQALGALTPQRWWGGEAEVAHALRGAREVGAWDDLHASPELGRLARCQVAPPLFVPVRDEPPGPCASFSRWWSRVRMLPPR